MLNEKCECETYIATLSKDVGYIYSTTFFLQATRHLRSDIYGNNCMCGYIVENGKPHKVIAVSKLNPNC